MIMFVFSPPVVFVAHFWSLRRKENLWFIFVHRHFTSEWLSIANTHTSLSLSCLRLSSFHIDSSRGKSHKLWARKTE